jgi:hypothetical protein
LCVACDTGNASGNEYAYDDAAGITHGDCDARTDVHRNADVSANHHRCAAHSDAKRDVHGDA